MKIECIKDKLKEAVGKVEKITGKNLTLPILSCILLEAKGGELTIRATNLDLGIEITIPVKVEKEGRVAVPGNVLHGFVASLYDEKNIKLETDGGNLIVSTPNTSTVIKSFAHEEFPTLPKVEGDKSFKVPAVDFVAGLESVWYSCATGSLKPELSSVYIYGEDDQIIFVATDSFRLAEKRIKLKKIKDFSHILIPFKNIADIIRILTDFQGEVGIHIGKNQISFTHANIYLTSRIIDGVFPDYKQIIPKDTKTEAVILKYDLVSSLKVANIFSDNFNQINLKVYPGSKIFELKTKNIDVGENLNKIPAALSGEDIDINFNYKYIFDCFQAIDT
ncbi:DNA polymerase III subunit beta, partial [Candidatus Parcubacteria bacterium]|nr:DNA polymerase III subunit beta [Candidatus Parcubacteria bacterium]